MKKTITKEVTFLIGRGENCQCGDCPVLYGGDCPYDKKPSKKGLITKKIKVNLTN